MGIDMIFVVVVLIMSVVLHEVSHGYAAYFLGDKTAKYAGRLTLNPIPHMDFFGSILLPAILIVTQSSFFIAWAKPVPYNPYNLRNQKWGSAIVAAAGPGINLFIALIFGLVLRFGYEPFSTIAAAQIMKDIVIINLVLAFFNLLPIPPLDGSKILFTILPYKWHHIQEFMNQYGMFIVLFVVMFLWRFLFFPISLFFLIITGWW